MDKLNKSKIGPNTWIGVDLDGTLAMHDGNKDPRHIGAPIETMVNRVKEWVKNGIQVKILTARVVRDYGKEPMRLPVNEAVKLIQDWTEQHIGKRLPVTAEKDPDMFQLWDDRAVSVYRNTGVSTEEKLEEATRILKLVAEAECDYDTCASAQMARTFLSVNQVQYDGA